MNSAFEPLMICLINTINQKSTSTSVSLHYCNILFTGFTESNFFHIQNQESFPSYSFSHDLIGDCAPCDLCPAIRLEEFSNYILIFNHM